MALNSQSVVFYVLALCYHFTKTLAEICDDGTRCTGGKECCSVGCCYEEDDDDERRYSYGYRLSIWNMWFVVLFLMMSCFGGCGYYKQRQRILRGQNIPNGRNLISVFQGPIYRRSRGPAYPDVSLFRSYRSGAEANTPQAQPPDSSMAPPPYTEVMSHPDMFPPNTKSTDQAPAMFMPPTSYPGQPNYSHHPLNTEPVNQMPQPPPYTEVANEMQADVPAANQNTTSRIQSSNQNDAH